MDLIILSSLFIVCIIMLIKPWLKKKIQLARWLKHYQVNQHENTFDHLYDSLNGFVVSKNARATRDKPELTYGEIDFKSFIALVCGCVPDKNTVFYDLGSGTGKAVIAMAMVFNIKKSCGIECLKPLHEAAINTKKKWFNELTAPPASQIEFYNQDFLQSNFNDATLIFINASALFGSIWDELCHQLKKTAAGTTIITTSKSIKDDSFQLFNTQPTMMSWGVVTAYIHKRL